MSKLHSTSPNSFLRKTTCFEKLYSYLFWTLSESSGKNFGTVVKTAIDMLSGTYWGFSVLKRWRIITIVRHSASKNLDSWRNFFGNCCQKCNLRVQKIFSEQFFSKKKNKFPYELLKGSRKFSVLWRKFSVCPLKLHFPCLEGHFGENEFSKKSLLYQCFRNWSEIFLAGRWNLHAWCPEDFLGNFFCLEKNFHGYVQTCSETI